MSEILKMRIEKSVGKHIRIFLKNNFKFEGKLTNFDETFIEILDQKINGFKVIEIEDIKELEVVE